MSDNFQVREGLKSDAKALSVLAEETFRDTFAHQYSPNDMKEFIERNYSEQLQLSELENPDYKTLIVVNDERIIAYCMIRFGSREEQIVAADPVAEIWRFYVSKSFIGRGIAQLLMDRVMEILKESKANVAWLGVWENNPRAQKFYRKYGFQEVGYHDFAVGSTIDRDLLFQLKL
ncbi:hypothetical protein HA402_003047 [Bradysia odoriphaga]|nr:hypothetical protein HA402_003047 [Bradysia odoriphaga]